jgi:hypothetical protein
MVRQYPGDSQARTARLELKLTIGAGRSGGPLPDGLTPSVDGKPKVSRRCATELCPRSCRLSSVLSEASRTSPTQLSRYAMH